MNNIFYDHDLNLGEIQLPYNGKINIENTTEKTVHVKASGACGCIQIEVRDLVLQSFQSGYIGFKLSARGNGTKSVYLNDEFNNYLGQVNITWN